MVFRKTRQVYAKNTSKSKLYSFFCINRQRYIAKSGIILQIFLMRESHVRNK